MTNKVRRFETIAVTTSAWLNWVTCAAFILMAVVTTIDVIGAKVFGKPFLLSFDIVSFCGLLAVVPAIAWIQANHGHIEVEILVRNLSKKAQKIIALIINILGIVLFIAMTWQMLDYAITVQRTTRVSAIAQMPFYPFAYFTALCFVLVIVVLVAQFLTLIVEEEVSK